jgi:hypothetical protein
MSFTEETRSHQRAMELHAGATNTELQKLGRSLEEQGRCQTQIAAGQQKIANLSQKQVELQSAMLDVQRKQLAVQEQTLVTVQLQLEQTQLQTLMQQVALIHRQRQRELKEAAFSVRRRLEQFRAEPDWLRVYVLVALELRDADSVGLVPSELEEITDKEYTEASLVALREAMASAESELSDSDRALLETVVSYKTAIAELEALRKQLQELNAKAKARRASQSRMKGESNMALGASIFAAGSGLYVGDITNGGLGSAFLLVAGILGFTGIVLRRESLSDSSTSDQRITALHESITEWQGRVSRLTAEREVALARVPEIERW